MKEFLINEKASNDFNKARFKDRVLNLLNVLTPERHELLSLKYVQELVKPSSQKYKGMRAIPIELIIGSEGRYRDFNKAFLPRREHLRRRWINIDKAHIKDIILPPIKLYEIGGVYFVRDGNHRVSVAKAQGIGAIDAEVTSLTTEIDIKPKMTRFDLMKAVIEYERKEFFNDTGLDKIVSPEELIFSETGRYTDIITHIEGHKYYLNLSKDHEISFEDAAQSWYDNLFKPIIEIVIEENILTRFPGRTHADLYVWIIRHWDDLKKKYGNDFPIEEAARSYSKRFGKSIWEQIKDFFKYIFKRK